ncbi:MAG: PAS domain S-box protein [Myxococcales bacterium]|nr:PAS domain S-box protein [Myxococcales bacterium]
MGSVPSSAEPSWPAMLADLAPVLLVWLDAAGRIRRVNEFFARFAGVDAARVVGEDWFERFVPPRDRERVRRVHATTDANTSGTINAIWRSDGSEAEIEWQNRCLRGPDGAFIGCISVGVDVTERLRVQRALERSEAMLAEAQRVAHVGSWELDLRTRSGTWSAETFRIFEVDPTRSDLYEAFAERVHADDRERSLRDFTNTIETGVTLDQEARLVMPDGRIKWVRRRATPSAFERDDAGNPTRMFGTVEDVTDRVAAAAAVANERTLLRSVIEAFPGAAGVYDLEGGLVTANHTAIAMSGRTAATERAPTWELPNWGNDQTRVRLQKGFVEARSGQASRFEVQVAIPGEGVVDVEAAFQPVRVGDQITHVAAFGVDVSARNRALERARGHEAQLIEAQRIAHVGSWELDHTTGTLSGSEELFRVFEVDAAHGMTRRALVDVVHPDDRDAVVAAFESSLQQRTTYEVVHRLRTPRGTLKHVRSRGEHAYGPDGQPLRSVGTVHDVTATVNAEEKLRRVLDAMAPLVAVLDLEGRFVEINKAPLDLVGRSRAEVLGTLVWEGVTWGGSSAVVLLREAFDRAVRGETYRTDLTAELADGSHFSVDATFRPVRDPDGHIVNVVASAVDITVRKQMEEELRQSEAKYRLVVEQASDAILIADADARFVDLNSRACDLLGYARHELLALTLSDLIDPADPVRPERLRAAGTLSVERSLRRKDGTWVVVEISATHLSNGNILGILRDVTERKRAEEAVLRSEKRLAEAHRLAQVGAWERDLRTGVGWWSDQLYEIFGAPRDEPRDFATFLARVHPDDHAIVRAAEPTALRDGVWEGDFRIVRPDGEVRYLHSVTEVIHRDGRPTVLAGTHQDVTTQRLAEAEIRRTSALLSSVIDSSTDWVFVKDAQHRYLLTNQAMAQAFACTPADMLGRLDTDLFRGSDPPQIVHTVHDSDTLAFDGTAVHLPAMPVTIANGDRRVFDVIKGPLRDDQGRIYGVLGYARDVTAARKAAEELARSLEEKETLLREIHHRVKNNLQILASLLHFQAKKARDAEQLAVFNEARSRIVAMILVHEKLYQSRDLSQVAFGDYVQSLTQVLAASFAGAVKVRVSVDTDALRLPLEVALPSGMILCELLTNVFKYAYPDASEGTARVVARREASAVRLRVEDEGVGLPSGFDPENVRSFGWHLVNNLVQQLEGELILGAGALGRGACIDVTFPLRAPTERPTP